MSLTCAMADKATFMGNVHQKRLNRSLSVRVVAGESRIGKKPVVIPDKVNVTIDGDSIRVKGPKGELVRDIPPLVRVEKSDGNLCKVTVADESKKAKQQHGLMRSNLNNMVLGVSSGFEKTLSLIGVGYRAQMSGKKLVLSLGYSHPVEMDVPDGLDVKVEKNTTIHILGYDKEVVGQFAADVRSKREPEPYKGKGVRYSDEYVARKEGKRGK